MENEEIIQEVRKILANLTDDQIMCLLLKNKFDGVHHRLNDLYILVTGS